MSSCPSRSHLRAPSARATATGNGSVSRTSCVTPPGSSRRARALSACDIGFSRAQRATAPSVSCCAPRLAAWPGAWFLTWLSPAQHLHPPQARDGLGCGWPPGSSHVTLYLHHAGEVPVMTGPQDPAAASGGRMRAGHADRDQAIETLKNAFVQGRLTRDELDARTGQALAARTYADLAVLTADIPPAPPPAAGLAIPPAPARP